MRGNSNLPTLVLAAFILHATQAAWGQTITFRKVADTNTPVPAGTGTFNDVCTPRIDEGNVVFVGTNTETTPDQMGIYMDIGGTLNVVADRNTPVPGGGVDFAYFDSRALSISGTDDAFNGILPGDGGDGVFASIDGVISLVADQATAAPGASGNFTGFGSLSYDGGSTVFGAGVSEIQSLDGIYTDLGGTLRVVADFDTPVPGETVNFTRFTQGVSIDGGVIAFGGESDSGYSLCVETEGILSVVVDEDTPIPGGTGNFSSELAYPSLDEGDIAFRHGSRGIYLVTESGVEVIADTDTPVPEGSGNFGLFDPPSLDRGNVAFRGIGSYNGIYVRMGGSILKIIDPTDQLDGKTPAVFSCGEEALSGNQVAFYVSFSEDGSKGVYVATIADMCGNTVVEGVEQCDDGNVLPGDGCNENCRFDPPIPAVTAWGAAVLLLILLVAGTVIIRRLDAAGSRVLS